MSPSIGQQHDREEWARRYFAAMDAGAAEWREVTDALHARGLRAEFTQTGGMCAAIMVPLDLGYLLITDRDDSLAWTRDEHEGWMVGLYTDEESTEGRGYGSCDASDTAALLKLVDRVLSGDFDE